VELSNEAFQFQHKKHDVTVQPVITYIYFVMHPVYCFPTVRGHNPNLMQDRHERTYITLAKYDTKKVGAWSILVLAVKSQATVSQ